MKKREPKKKKCAHCSNEFTPFLSTQIVCSHTCAAEHAKTKRKEKELKDWNKKKKTMEEDLRSHSQWMGILQKIFNEWIRLRDYHEPCISCQSPTSPQWCAGHFFHAGNYPAVRVDPDNVHKQCNKNCNMELGGNLHKYRPNLINKIGEKRFQELEDRANQSQLKLSVPEIKEQIAQYRIKVKELKKSLHL